MACFIGKSYDSKGEPISALAHYFKELKVVAITLDAEEEKKLAQRYRANKDPKALDKLIKANLRFVVEIAKNYANRRILFEDLIGAGNEGLLLAVMKFNPDKGVRLYAFAAWYIRRKILEEIYYNSDRIRLYSEGIMKVKIRILYNFPNVDWSDEIVPSVDEIVTVLKEEYTEKYLELSEDEIRKKNKRLQLNVQKARKLLILEAYESLIVSDEFDFNLIAKKENTPEEQVIFLHIWHIFEKIIEKLSPKEREIFERRYGLNDREPEEILQIAKDFGVEGARISQIHCKTMAYLKSLAQMRYDAYL